jgi:predicted ATPase
VRTLLKVMACFGTSTNASVIGYLSESVVYSGFRDRLEVAICEGFIEMDGGGNFKFAHDKVREAAYDLIPDSYKKQVRLVCFVIVSCAPTSCVLQPTIN